MRVLIVLVVLFVVALGGRLYRQWRRRLVSDDRAVPRLPAELIAGSERTWVIFTTPWCASCGPVEELLRTEDPGAGVVKVDAAREPHLAKAFRVHSAPTVLLSDREGEVRARLVGAPAVTEYVDQASKRPKPPR